MSKKILITGAAGFIGANLCEFYLKTGHEVIGIDNFCTGQQKNVYALKHYKGFQFYKLDCNTLQSSDYCRYFGKDIAQIYHLASPASPPKYYKLAFETIRVNTVATEELLKYATEVGATFLFASTSEVYGDPLEHPQVETYYGNVNPYGSRGLYDNAKRLGETFCFEYKKHCSTDVRVARIFNTVGPKFDLFDGRVVTEFIMQRFDKKPYTIFGSGAQTRSFCYVDDMVEGLHKLMNYTDFKHPINLGNTEEITILDLARKIDIIFAKREKRSRLFEMSMEHKSLPQDDPKQRKPNIEQANILLDWWPKTSLQECLEKTINYVVETKNGVDI